MTDLLPTLSVPASGAHSSTPAGHAIVPGVRPLTAAEVGHLDRARAHLRASGVDLTDPAAVGALLHATRTHWAAEPGAPVPHSMVMALGVGVGDLVVARVPDSRWALRTAGAAPTPAVVSLSGEDAALPLADVATRWRTGSTPTWVAEYVAAAAAHLAAPTGHGVPTPRVPTRTADDFRADEPATLSARATAAQPASATAVLPAVEATAAAATPPPPPAAPPALPAYRAPADLPHPPSAAAQDIALGVLEQALEVALAQGGAAAPFAVVDGRPAQSHQPHRFEGDPALALQEARAWVRSTGAARAAVAWFGQLPEQEGDAVFVEASDTGAPSLVIAHRYSAASRGEGRTRPALPVGDPLILGQGEPLL
ncbi:hypothetical protein [Cellulomonas sp. Leaf395]|uniref:hypothetical protein n=1 Tax=Cellulomonas sp. Leaf395 TaxID=1736362 RepID=UPI000700BAEF|nr:hypothetical protein [Cellulomonas sp. Leaf395]KQT02125.1 hypothetical protein ASG23_01870 [Cellulomonas sp. Leaf395]